jgi:hypothetical protein
VILTAHQPAYLPWLGYFDRIHSAQVFVFLDSVQFETNSYINRNKIKSPQGELWLTVPVHSKGHTGDTIQNLTIDSKSNWKKKHLGAIHANYRRAPRFDAMYPDLERLYQSDHSLLSDLCFEHLMFWLGQLGLKPKVVKSSTLGLRSSKSDLILDICRALGANHYLSGSQGRNYLREDDFRDAGIAVRYQDYTHPEYPQLWGNTFVPRLSVLDFLMNASNANFAWGI